MTERGLCQTAAYAETRLTPELARELRPAWSRSIVYAADWQTVIDNARDLQAVGVKSLIVFNTEADSSNVEDVAGHAANLDAFLRLADGAVAAIEPGNELDTPGWGISDELMIRIGRACAEVCHRYGVIALAPSLLSGPGEGRFEAVARGLAGHVDAMAVHPYGRSVGGAPSPGWIWGSVEDAADECQRLGSGLPTWFTEAGCWTRDGGLGQPAQARWTGHYSIFQHPAIPVAFQFALHDRSGGAGEIAQGKDWGLIADGGARKISFYTFASNAPAEPAPPPIVVPPAPAPVPVPIPPVEVIPMFTAGPGVLSEMAKVGDSPATDELYHPIGAHPGNSQYSETFGKSGIRYVYVFSTNQTYRFHPDPIPA